MPPTALENLGAALLEATKEAQQSGLKHDASGTPNAGFFHGSAGILSLPGLDPTVYGSIVGIEQGMIGELIFTPSLSTVPYFETLTGIQGDTGSEPSTQCADCKTAGLTKGCTLTATFGRYCRQTREISIERVGEIVNRAEPMDLMLANLLRPPMSPLQPEGMIPGGFSLQSEVAKQFLEFGTSVSREMAQQIWQGNPANNVGTGHIEFQGFDLLIATGHTDTVSGTSCPSLDSDIKDFNYQLISDTNPADIVQVLSAMVHFVKRNAETMGFMPVSWVLAMTPTMFHELSQLWPCRYSTNGCSVVDTTTGRVNLTGTEMVLERDRLRRMKVLPIEGIEFPVITDQGIAEESNGDNANIPPGQFASDIYLIPMRVQNTRIVTHMEYFNLANPNALELVAAFDASGVKFTNGGAWMWTNARVNGCIKTQGVMRPRLIMRTPQLAGRITNIRVNPLQHERTPFPGDDTYFANGGDTTEDNWPS